MLPWETLDRAAIPGGGELRLKRRGTELSIMLGSNELMNSRLSNSERALAELTAAAIAERAAPRLLIGGLGMGFTLRAALAALGPDARITVAELLPKVIEWARGPMADLFAGCLDDRRVDVVAADVADLIAAERGRFDAILLDVDNGPDGLTTSANDALYGPAGLGDAWQALRPGGVLAVWSAAPDRRFSQRLRQAGFTVREERVRAHGGPKARAGGATHVIWIATRNGPA